MGLNGFHIKCIIGIHCNWKINVEVNGLDWQCCLAGSSKRAPRILIFSIAMGADSSFYVQFIATYAPTFLAFIISILAMVHKMPQKIWGLDSTYFIDDWTLHYIFCKKRHPGMHLWQKSNAMIVRHQFMRLFVSLSRQKCPCSFLAHTLRSDFKSAKHTWNL